MFCTKNAHSRPEYAPGDPVLIENIVLQLKSQGVFDQFRKECISDVDTKPAYQNLCHRVDGRVEAFLSETKWIPDLNRNQLRESIRKHVNECTFVDSGISRIVDQLVNPRINTVLVPKVEEIVYDYLGIKRPENDQFENSQPVPQKTKLPANNYEDYHEGPASRITSNQQNQLSSDNVHSDFKSKGNPEYVRPFTTETVNLELTNTYSDFDSDDDDTSPPFEPLVKSDDELSTKLEYSPIISDSKCHHESHPSVVLKLDTTNAEFEPLTTVLNEFSRDIERVYGDENEVSDTDSCEHKLSSHEPSSSLSLPATPIINCKMTGERQDTDFNQNLRHTCSDKNSFMKKVSEDDRGSSSNFKENYVDENCKTKREQEMVGLNEESGNEVDSGGSEDSAPNEKNSDSTKYRSHNLKKDHKSHKDKDKDRSSRPSKDARNRDCDERSTDADRSKYLKKSSKHDSRHRDSLKRKSSSEKNQSSSSRSKDNSKDDRKVKNSFSKYDTKRDREKSSNLKKETSEAKKNKTQCNMEEKKMRTDRRSSDRDSNGPFTSLQGSTSYRISNKTDKDRHRNSSSSTSSHKTEKTPETRKSDASFDTMSEKGNADLSSNIVVTPLNTNIQNANCTIDTLNKNGESKMLSREENNLIRTKEEKEDGEFVENKEIRCGNLSELNDTSVVSRKDTSSGDEPLRVRASDQELKKPKIARNAADILRIMKLRKQYEQKLEAEQLSQQRGKENTVSSSRKKVSSIDDNYRKSILSQRMVDDKHVKQKVNKNGENRRGEVTNSLNDCELKIWRIDSYYRLLNGSCTLNQVQNYQSIGNKGSINVHEFDASNGNEDSNNEKHLKLNAQSQLKDTKTNDCQNDPSKVKMILPSRGCNVTKRCLGEEIDEVRYFESAELNNDFVNFVSERVKQMEDIYLERFSIQLMCPARYDFIFRDHLGAIVKREYRKSETMSSPFKYNSEIIDGKIGNEKGIMMRITKTVLEKECVSLPNSNGSPKKLTNSVIDISVNSNRVVSNGKSKAVKRRLSNPISIMNSKMVEPNHITDLRKAFDSKEFISAIQLHDSEIVDNEQIPLTVPGSQKSSTSSISSAHSSGVAAPKMLKTISKEQKRRQFYYEANDLYKPRPSFILSSRRSRGLDPNTA